MTITELGAVGELVGAIAVVGSLLFVGLQVRHSTEQATRANRIAQSESQRAMARDWNAIAMPMTDADLGSAYRRALQDYYALTLDEQSRLHWWLVSAATHMTAILLDEESDLVDPQLALGYFGAFAAIVKTTGGSAWWAETKPFMNPVFVRRIDEIATGEAPPPLTRAFSWYAADARDSQEV